MKHSGILLRFVAGHRRLAKGFILRKEGFETESGIGCADKIQNAVEQVNG
jgi:hypothetical protein